MVIQADGKYFKGLTTILQGDEYMLNFEIE